MVNLSVIILIFNKNILSALLNFDMPQSSVTIAIFRSLTNLSIWNRVTLSNQFFRRGALLKLSEGAWRNPSDFRVASWRLLSVPKFATAFWKRLVMTASLSPLLPVPLWRTRQILRCCRACGNGGGGGGGGVVVLGVGAVCSIYWEQGGLLSSRTSGREDVATSRTCAFNVSCWCQLHCRDFGTKFLGFCKHAESGLVWERHVPMVPVLPTMQLNPCIPSSSSSA